MKNINRGFVAGVISVGLLAGMTPLAMAQEANTSGRQGGPNPTVATNPDRNPTNTNPEGEPRSEAQKQAAIKEGGELAEGGVFVVGHKNEALPDGKWNKGFTIASAYKNNKKGLKSALSWENMPAEDMFQNKDDKSVQVLHEVKDEGIPNLITWERVDSSSIKDFDKKAQRFQEANRIPKDLTFWVITETELVPKQEVKDYWKYLQWQSDKERRVKNFEQFKGLVGDVQDAITGKKAVDVAKAVWDKASGQSDKDNKDNKGAGAASNEAKDAEKERNAARSEPYKVEDNGILYFGDRSIDAQKRYKEIPREHFREGLVVAYDAPTGPQKFEARWFDVEGKATTVKVYEGEDGRLVSVYRDDNGKFIVVSWDKVAKPEDVFGYESYIKDMNYHGGILPDGVHIYKMDKMETGVERSDVEKKVDSLSNPSKGETKQEKGNESKEEAKTN